MSEQESPAKALREFRSILVARRRNIVSITLGLRRENAEPWDGANNGPDFQLVQEHIDAVDRAMADEENLGASQNP